MSQVVSSGFRGSDTDELDQIVKKLKQTAQYVDLTIRALQLLVKALKAMSWTGYAAALAAYLEGVVIPALQVLSRNLKMFAQIVSIASLVQKQTSESKPVVHCGDAGFVPARVPPRPVTAGSNAGGASVAVTKPAPIGQVQQTPTPELLRALAADVAAIKQALDKFIQGSSSQGAPSATPSTPTEKLQSIIGQLEQLVAQLGGSDDKPGATGSAPGADTGSPGTGSAGTGSGSSGGSGGSPAPSTGGGSSAPGTGSQPSPGTSSPAPFDPVRLYNEVSDVLRELGIDVPRIDDSSGGAPTPGSGLPNGRTIAGDVDAIQSALDNLRTDLGLPPHTPAPGVGTFETGPALQSPDTPTDPAASYGTGSPLGSGSPEGSGSGGGTGGGTGGGSPSGGGTGGGSGGGDGKALPTYTAAPASGVPLSAPSAPTLSETRYVAMSDSSPSSTANAAIPVSIGAVAASLAGRAIAKKVAGADDTAPATTP